MTRIDNNIKRNKSRKVLAIDDSPIDLALLKVHLQKMGLTALLTQDAKMGVEMAISEQPDLILLDVVMPDISGFEVCKKLKADARTSDIPIIFISANDQPCNKSAGLNAGAIDYIGKPYDPGELKARIESVLRTLELKEEISSLAYSEVLTGLANRRYFFDILERQLFQAKIKGEPLTIMMLDIDRFKQVNDSFGHPVGDKVLIQMGKILRDNIYPLDTAARFGGDEFIVLMPQTPYAKAIHAAEKLRTIIDQWQWNVSEKRISITVSIGLAALEDLEVPDLDEFVKRVDDTLYVAKRQGRNRTVCWKEINSYQTVQEPENRSYGELQNKVSLLAEQLRHQMIQTISTLMKAMASKDLYTAHHAQRVQVYNLAIAEEMMVSTELKERLNSAALLHDIGKFGIPDSILQKTSPLSKYDRGIIEQHPITSVEILAPIGVFNRELPIIRQHHERFDGNGYPEGLKDKEITIGARILAVADVFDALTSDRPYRLAMSYEDALVEILDCSGSQFDPNVVEIFQMAYEKHKEEWPLAAEKCLVESI